MLARRHCLKGHSRTTWSRCRRPFSMALIAGREQRESQAWKRQVEAGENDTSPVSRGARKSSDPLQDNRHQCQHLYSHVQYRLKCAFNRCATVSNAHVLFMLIWRWLSCDKIIRMRQLRTEATKCSALWRRGNILFAGRPKRIFCFATCFIAFFAILGFYCNLSCCVCKLSMLIHLLFPLKESVLLERLTCLNFVNLHQPTTTKNNQ